MHCAIRISMDDCNRALPGELGCHADTCRHTDCTAPRQANRELGIFTLERLQKAGCSHSSAAVARRRLSQPVTRGLALSMTALSSGPVARPTPQAQQLSNDRCYAERRANSDPLQKRRVGVLAFVDMVADRWASRL